MKKLLILVVIMAMGILSGCSHAQWVTAEANTDLAGFVNPLGFAINMIASAGEYATRPAPSKNPIEE